MTKFLIKIYKETFLWRIQFFITIKNIKAKLVKETKVFVGGNTLGFNITCNGVIIVGENSVLTDKGDISPFKNSSLREGDAIIEIMDKQVTGIESIFVIRVLCQQISTRQFLLNAADNFF